MAKTCEDYGVIAHVPGGGGLTCRVGDTNTELVVTRRNEAAIFQSRVWQIDNTTQHLSQW